MSTQAQTPPLVNFYSPTTQAKINGQTLSQILAYSDTALEYHHDYIQLLFPLPEGSPFNPSAPIINEKTFLAFRQTPELGNQLRRSFTRMLAFYGFEFRDSSGGLEIERAANFSSASRNWVKRFNHNHLRITRILRCLRVLGLEREASEFFKALKGVYAEGKIGEKSLLFWTRAVKRPLWMKPDDEDGESEEGNWLWEWEVKNDANAEIKETKV